MSNVLTALLVFCALMVTLSVLHREFGSHPRQFQITRHVENWRSLVKGKTIIGDRNAPVIVVEFSDYECPFCRDLEPKLQAFTDGHPDEVALVRYDFPLTKIHPHAYQAAVAAKCAARQHVYRPYQELLFDNGEHLGKVDLVKLAERSDVPDLTAFSTCIQHRATATDVELDRKIGRQLGVDATPTLVINGDIVPGTHSQAALNQLLEHEYKKATRSGFWNLIDRFL